MVLSQSVSAGTARVHPDGGGKLSFKGAYCLPFHLLLLLSEHLINTLIKILHLVSS